MRTRPCNAALSREPRSGRSSVRALEKALREIADDTSGKVEHMKLAQEALRCDQ